MRILVAWGSKHGGTEGIGHLLGEALARAGHGVTTQPAREVRTLDDVDAVVLGGALYANRWHRDARRFVERHVKALRTIPVWLYSSGPLDESADAGALAPPPSVQALMERIGALGHTTFGGRLEPTVTGFPEAAMAKTHAGDWRNPARIQTIAAELARVLPTAHPLPAIEPPGHAWARLVAFALWGGAASAALRAGLFALSAPTALTLALHAIVTTFVFVWFAAEYFAPRGARAPLPSALVFAVGAGAGVAWPTIVMVFFATWLTGVISSMRGMPKAPPSTTRPARA